MTHQTDAQPAQDVPEPVPAPPVVPSAADASRARRVALLDGRMVSSWSQEWLEECRDREQEARKTLAMVDRETRIAHLAQFERARVNHAQLHKLDCDWAA